MFEVYLYGMISPSTVYILEESFSFPEPNHYAEIKQSFSSVGGEAVNSAVVLSKLGVTTKLDGNWLNQDNADKIRNLLHPFDIDISRLTIKKKFGTEEIVITDKNSRTVFGNYASFHSGERQWNESQEIDIQNARMISIDPYFKEESMKVAQICVRNQKPYVTIDSQYDEFLAQNADAVIISHELREQAYPEGNMVEIFEHYQAHCKGLIIFTFGSDDIWYSRQGQQMKKFKPYIITPIDTAGAGDSFRAGIIFGLLNSYDDELTINFASAVAACVCLSVSHTLHAPDLGGILQFMKANKSK